MVTIKASNSADTIMKSPNQTYVSGTVSMRGAVLVLAVVGVVMTCEAQIYTINNKNSSAQIDVASGPGGVFNWVVDGVDQLNQQWFYYRAGSAGPEHPIESIDNTPVIATPNTNRLDLTYANSGYSVKVAYTLTGSTAGSGNSGLQEQITVQNTSSSNVVFHFFQYSDFDLGGVTGGQAVRISTNAGGQFTAVQTSSWWRVTETVAVPLVAPRVEAAVYNQTWLSLTDGNPTTLNGVTNAGFGNVTFTAQWDMSLAPGGSKVFSKIMTVVPEPSSFALVSLGVLAAVGLRRRSPATRNCRSPVNRFDVVERREFGSAPLSGSATEKDDSCP
jgi:hypothetical protein